LRCKLQGAPSAGAASNAAIRRALTAKRATIFWALDIAARSSTSRHAAFFRAWFRDVQSTTRACSGWLGQRSARKGGGPPPPSPPPRVARPGFAGRADGAAVERSSGSRKFSTPAGAAASSAPLMRAARSACPQAEAGCLSPAATWWVDSDAGPLIPKHGPAQHSRVFPGTQGAPAGRPCAAAPGPPWCCDPAAASGHDVFGLVANEACGMQRTAPPLRRWVRRRRPPHRRSARTGPGDPVDPFNQCSWAGASWPTKQPQGVRQLAKQVPRDRAHKPGPDQTEPRLPRRREAEARRDVAHLSRRISLLHHREAGWCP